MCTAHSPKWNHPLHHFFNILNSLYVVEFIVLVPQSRFSKFTLLRANWPIRVLMKNQNSNQLELRGSRQCVCAFVWVCCFIAKYNHKIIALAYRKRFENQTFQAHLQLQLQLQLQLCWLVVRLCSVLFCSVCRWEITVIIEMHFRHVYNLQCTTR